MKNNPAIIIACTFGANIVTSLQALGDSFGGDLPELTSFAGDKRNSTSVFQAIIKRHCNLENLTLDQ